jgi:Putative integral membrane protein (DUF2391)
MAFEDMRARRRKRQLTQSNHKLEDLVRGAGGGFLFGIPQAYTIQAWWMGYTATPALMLLAIATVWMVVFF